MCTSSPTDQKEAPQEPVNSESLVDSSTSDQGSVEPSAERTTPDNPAQDTASSDKGLTEPEKTVEVQKEAQPDNTTPDISPDTPYACPSIKTTKVPASLGLDSFYEKYVDMGGIPLIGSNKVPDEAFAQAYYQVANMLNQKPCIRKALVNSGIRVGIIAESEVTTNMPEYSDLNKVYPNVDWDTRGRGFGATLVRPLTTDAVENLLQKRSDRWFGESILIHEFAHTYFDFGIFSLEKGAQHQATLNKLFTDAMQTGLWDKTYAKTNSQEYWAETVQSWLNNNKSANPPNGIHNDISTREKLEGYDPKMAAFIAQFMDATLWSAYCTTSGPSRPWKDPTPTDLSNVSCNFSRYFLKDLGCPNVSQLKSQNSTTQQSITFVNRTFNTTYNVEWIDLQGQRQNRGKVLPRRTLYMSTSQGHSWVITDAQNKCVAAFTTSHPANFAVME